MEMCRFNQDSHCDPARCFLAAVSAHEASLAMLGRVCQENETSKAGRALDDVVKMAQLRYAKISQMMECSSEKMV